MLCRTPPHTTTTEVLWFKVCTILHLLQLSLNLFRDPSVKSLSFNLCPQLQALPPLCYLPPLYWLPLFTGNMGHFVSLTQMYWLFCGILTERSQLQFLRPVGKSFLSVQHSSVARPANVSWVSDALTLSHICWSFSSSSSRLSVYTLYVWNWTLLKRSMKLLHDVRLFLTGMWGRRLSFLHCPGDVSNWVTQAELVS